MKERFSALKNLVSSFKRKKIFKFWESGDYEAVVNMIQSKTVEVDVKDGNPKNWTPLMHACCGGHFEMVKFLLENGADVHVKSTKKEWTSLTIAASCDRVRIANLLLRNGANPNDIIDPDNWHYTALMYISDLGYVEMARVLLKNGADLDIPNKIDNTTPLFDAIQSGKEKMVELLLEYNADCNRQAHRGWTPLMESARSSFVKICKMLFDSGAKTELVMEEADKVSGEAALHVACYHGEADVARAIIEGDADINKENEIRLTPLMIASKRGHVDTVKTLVESKSLDVNHLHKQTGFSSFFSADSIEICETLLEHGAFPDIEGISIVDCAPHLRKKTVKELVTKYKSINLQVQTETLFEDRPLSDNVVPLEEFHAELQIESQKEHRKDLSRELKDKTKWKGWLNQMMQQ